MSCACDLGHPEACDCSRPVKTMTDADVVALGVRYRALMTEATSLRWSIREAINAVNRNEVDCAFGRELVAALGNLEAMPDA